MVAAVVNNLEHFEKLTKEAEDPVVIFCGPELSSHFDMFENLAKDKKYLYYHILDRGFCTRINTRRTGAEKHLWLEKGDYTVLKIDEKHKVLAGKGLATEQIDAAKHQLLNSTNEVRKAQNQTLATASEISVKEIAVAENDEVVNEEVWSTHLIQEPVAYVVYNKNAVFEQVKISQDIHRQPAPQSATQSGHRLKRELEYASISNFYTNFDTLYDFLYDDKYSSQIFAVFSPQNQTASEFPCSAVSTLAAAQRLSAKSIKFGCFSREELPKFGLEIHDYLGDSHTLFFFSYFDIFTKKEGKISRPFRYKLENPRDSQQVEGFLQDVLAQKVQKRV